MDFPNRAFCSFDFFKRQNKLRALINQGFFYEYESSQYGDGVLLDEYRREFSLVAAKRKDGKVFMEWVFELSKDEKLKLDGPLVVTNDAVLLHFF